MKEIYERLRSKIRDPIRSMTNNSNDHDEKCMNSNDDLLLNETLEIHNIKIVLRAVFHEGNKYYPQVFLDECL